MNERAWRWLKTALDDLSDDETNWRPLPQANSINIIVRHLRIEAQWHLDSLLLGKKMPTDLEPALQKDIDAVPLDFSRNIDELQALGAAFVDALRTTTLQDLRSRTASAYGSTVAGSGTAYLLGYHQAMHVMGHVGQIRMIRNLYRKARGEPAKFYPVNPTYPQ
jgi:hypothetical protein